MLFVKLFNEIYTCNFEPHNTITTRRKERYARENKFFKDKQTNIPFRASFYQFMENKIIQH